MDATTKVLYWYDKWGKRHLGAHSCLTNVRGLWGDCSNVYGNAGRVMGRLTKYHRGHLGNLSGDVSLVRGSLTGKIGIITVIGDVSGVTGCISGFTGNATGVKVNADFIDGRDRLAHPNIAYWHNR